MYLHVLQYLRVFKYAVQESPLSPPSSDTDYAFLVLPFSKVPSTQTVLNKYLLKNE